MKTLFNRWSAIASVAGLLTVLLAGCVATGDGYGYGYAGGVGIGVDYYEPFGAYYGGWGPGYNVGPMRGGGYHPNRGGGQPPLHAFRPAPESHSLPSIPSRPHFGELRPHPGELRPH